MLITLVVVLVWWYLDQLPLPIQQAIPMMPYVLFAAVMLLALYFNLSGLFYLTICLALNWYLLSYKQLTVPLAADLVFTCSAMAVLMLMLLKDKGLLTLAAWLTHLSMLLLVALPVGLMARDSTALSAWLQPQLVPESWFTWSPLGATAWLLALVLMVALGLMLWFQHKRQALNGLLVLATIMCLYHWSDDKLLLNLISSGCLMALLFSALQKSWHLAYVDELTALPGRRALEERLQRSLGIYALAMLDVDHFKKFNDTYGHDVGDDVLRMIAAKIGQVGGGGKAFRYGGEEFTVVFSNHSADEIKHHLQAVIDDIANSPFVVNRRKNQKPQSVQVTISIGLTDSIHKANSAAAIKTADEALYQAKKKGRNRIVCKT